MPSVAHRHNRQLMLLRERAGKYVRTPRANRRAGHHVPPIVLPRERAAPARVGGKHVGGKPPLPAVAALHKRRVGEKNRRVGRRERMEIAMVGTLLAHGVLQQIGCAKRRNRGKRRLLQPRPIFLHDDGSQRRDRHGKQQRIAGILHGLAAAAQLLPMRRQRQKRRQKTQNNRFPHLKIPHDFRQKHNQPDNNVGERHQQHRAGRQILGMLHSLVALAGHPVGKRLHSGIDRLGHKNSANAQRNRHPLHGRKPKPPTAAHNSYRRHDMDARIVLATQQPHNARKGIRKTFRPFLPTELFGLFHIANLHIFSLFFHSPINNSGKMLIFSKNIIPL